MKTHSSMRCLTWAAVPVATRVWREGIGMRDSGRLALGPDKDVDVVG